MTECSKDLVLYRMTRADETMEDVRILAKAGRWNACVNRLYYACFYAVSALLVRDGLSSSKHAGVRSHFNRHYVKTGRIPKELARVYNDLFERRQEGDYTLSGHNLRFFTLTPTLSRRQRGLRKIATDDRARYNYSAS